MQLSIYEIDQFALSSLVYAHIFNTNCNDNHFLLIHCTYKQNAYKYS